MYADKTIKAMCTYTGFEMRFDTCLFVDTLQLDLFIVWSNITQYYTGIAWKWPVLDIKSDYEFTIKLYMHNVYHINPYE